MKLVLDFQMVTGRGGEGKKWQTQCREAAADEPSTTIPAPTGAKAHGWQDATPEELQAGGKN